MLKNKPNISELRDNFKCCNTLNWSPQRKGGRKEDRKIFEEIFKFDENYRPTDPRNSMTFEHKTRKNMTPRHTTHKLVRNNPKENRF